MVGEEINVERQAVRRKTRRAREREKDVGLIIGLKLY